MCKGFCVGVVGEYLCGHDVEAILENHQVISSHLVDLLIDETVGFEQGHTAIASDRVVVYAYSPPSFQNDSVSGESLCVGQRNFNTVNRSFDDNLLDVVA